MDTKMFPFSKDLFDPTANAWSFFTYDDGIGFITDSSRFLYDNSGKRMMAEEGRIDKNHTVVAKALLQWVYTDFLKR
jgi:hypothetical protein